MGKRGPKAARLATAPEVGKRQPERVLPLPGMNTRARSMWKKIVDSLPADHFQAGDLPLLRDYCEAYDRSAQAETEIKRHGLLVAAGSGLVISKSEDGKATVEQMTLKANPAVAIKTAAAHTMKALAVALRLCANSRMTPKQAGKEEKPAATPSKRKMFGG
ncbi:phage terminase small subunit P27 family [Solidesulfovibrio sp.]